MAERHAASGLWGGQRYARVEDPADQQDALLRTLHQPREQRVIIGGVDDHPRLARAFDPPAIAPRFDDWGEFGLAHRRRHAWRRQWLRARTVKPRNTARGSAPSSDRKSTRLNSSH